MSPTKLDSPALQALTDVAMAAARRGGQQLMEKLGTADVRTKGPRDFVTEADFASQRVIREHLLDRYPDHQFIGEESVAASSQPSPRSPDSGSFCWIVDPLDGTTNYVHQLPSFSVSIGLEHEGVPVVGVVWDPVLEEMYHAYAGGGAFLNGRAIRCSDCTDLGAAMVVISLTKNVTRNDRQVDQFLSLLESAGTLRRLGSAALNLCYVAHGRVDAYWATRLQHWDVAAGALIATEAGATLRSLDGGVFNPREPRLICTATEPLFEATYRIVGTDNEGRSSGH